MSPEELAQAVPELQDASHSDKLRLFGWHLHVHEQRTHFQPSDVKKYYERLHLVQPSGFGGYFQQLVTEKTLLKNASGYRLESKPRAALDAKYGMRQATIQITALLQNLPARIPDLAERTFLDEALVCFKHGAKRAAIVMTWNLAYHHLCHHVMTKHLAEFNARWQARYPKHHKDGVKAIAQVTDFGEELRESEVLEICKSAKIVTNDVYKILQEKLGRRNSAAHPSDVTITQVQVEAFIDDLVTNVVLKLT
jgi:hypothetical protein